MKMNWLTALALAVAGTAGSADAAVVFVNSDITANTTWSSANEYVLQRPIFVKNGAILTIGQGTIVRGQPRTGPVQAGQVAGSPGALIVTQNGYLRAEGTQTDPIIFTTAAIDNNGDDIADAAGGFKLPYTGATDTFLDNDPKNKPLAPLDGAGNGNVQLWGGLVLLGKAPTNLANACGVGWGKCTIEGLTIPGFPAADATYGGLNPHDNSGTLRYASIRYAGDEIGEGNELNGLSLGGVGDGTTIDNVDIFVNFDDGIEWFGGTVGVKHAIVAFIGDDSFDADQGYTGVNQFLFAVQTYFNNNNGSTFGSASGDKLCEFDGDDLATDNPALSNNVSVQIDVTQSFINPSPSPFSGFAFWNMTLVGSSLDGTLAYPPTSPNAANLGCQFRNGAAGMVFNSIITDTGVNTALTVGGGGVVPVTTNIANGNTAAVCISEQHTAGLSDNAALIANGNALALTLPGGSALSASGTLTNNFVNQDPTLPLQGNDSGRLNAALSPRGTTQATKFNPRAKAGPNTASCPQPRWDLGGVDPAATYRGAFSPVTGTNLWTTGWTVLNKAGILAD